ncbi:MAG: TIGR03560 family F420-dependent LLM class oxidoreductase [Actinomycetota bacterium]
MRFSFWPSAAQPWPEILEPCRHAEATGWDGLWIADHFLPFAGDVDEPMLEAWSALTALAVEVPRVRLGTLVCGNTYRHPAVLANQAATTDVVAGGGRVVLGIGAGWQENEHSAYGIELGSVRWRLDRFEEACSILRSLLREERTDHLGEHYTLTDAPMQPKSGGTAPMPLLVGGGGEQRTLRITARYADEWNVWGDPAILRHKGAVLDAHCDDVGRDPAEIERSAVALVFLSDDEAWLDRIRGRDIERPHMIGTPEQLVEVVAEFRDAGVDELIVPDFSLGGGQRRLDTMDTFLTEVAAEFRS